MANELKRHYVSDVVIVAKAAKNTAVLMTLDTETNVINDFGKIKSEDAKSTDAVLLKAVTMAIEYYINHTSQIGIVVPNGLALRLFMIQKAFNAEGVNAAKETYRTPAFEWLTKSKTQLAQHDKFVNALAKAQNAECVIAITKESDLYYVDLKPTDDRKCDVQVGDTIHLTPSTKEGEYCSVDEDNYISCSDNRINGEFEVKSIMIGKKIQLVIDRPLDFDKYESDIEISNTRIVLNMVNEQLPRQKLIEGEAKVQQTSITHKEAAA